MSDDYQTTDAANRGPTRQMADTFQVGTVHEVKGTKMRMVIGKDKDGKDDAVAWLNTSQHRGGATEQRFYKKGQTLVDDLSERRRRAGHDRAVCAEQGFQDAGARRRLSGQDEESYQLEDYRAKQTKDGYDQWLQPMSRRNRRAAARRTRRQGGGGGKEQKKGHTGGDKAKMKSAHEQGRRHHASHRQGRAHACAQGGREDARSDDWVVVKKGKIIFIAATDHRARPDQERRQVTLPTGDDMALQQEQHLAKAAVILQKFYVYDPGVHAGDELGGAARSRTTTTRRATARPRGAADDAVLDRSGLARREPLDDLSDARQEAAGAVHARAQRRAVRRPTRVPTYARRSGAVRAIRHSRQQSLRSPRACRSAKKGKTARQERKAAGAARRSAARAEAASADRTAPIVGPAE